MSETLKDTIQLLKKLQREEYELSGKGWTKDRRTTLIGKDQLARVRRRIDSLRTEAAEQVNDAIADLRKRDTQAEQLMAAAKMTRRTVKDVARQSYLRSVVEAKVAAAHYVKDVEKSIKEAEDSGDMELLESWSLFGPEFMKAMPKQGDQKAYKRLIEGCRAAQDKFDPPEVQKAQEFSNKVIQDAVELRSQAEYLDKAYGVNLDRIKRDVESTRPTYQPGEFSRAVADAMAIAYDTTDGSYTVALAEPHAETVGDAVRGWDQEKYDGLADSMTDAEAKVLAQVRAGAKIPQFEEPIEAEPAAAEEGES